MPAVSKKQKRAMSVAYAAKKGKIPPEELKGPAKKLYESMSEEQLREFAATKEKGLPEKKKKRDTKVSSKVI